MSARNPRRRRFQVELLEGRVALAGPPTAVVAPTNPAKPEVVTVDETFVDPELSAHCGFPVQVHEQDRLIRRTDTDGNTTTTTINVDVRVTFTNLSNGKSLIQRQTGLIRNTTTLNPDGTITITSDLSGLHNQLSVPGQGIVSQSAGRISGGSLILDLSTDPPTIVSAVPPIVHGRDDQTVIDICSLLA